MATVGVKGLVLYLHFSDGVTVHTEYSSYKLWCRRCRCRPMRSNVYLCSWYPSYRPNRWTEQAINDMYTLCRQQTDMHAECWADCPGLGLPVRCSAAGSLYVSTVCIYNVHKLSLCPLYIHLSTSAPSAVRSSVDGGLFIYAQRASVCPSSGNRTPVAPYKMCA